MPIHIFPMENLPPFCIVNGFPIYKFASYVYCKRKRELHLIRPSYHPCLSKEIQHQLNIIPIVSVNGSPCSIIKHTLPVNCQNSHIWSITIPTHIELDNTITVCIDNHTFTAHAIDVFVNNTIQDITACTLFKHDYKNTKIYIDYYYNYYNIKSYLLYYNGNIDTIHEYISSLSCPSDCNVIFFSFDHPYWQTFCGKDDITIYFPHSSQNIQLSHSSIIADSWSNSLINIDYDEYLRPDININNLLKKYDTIRLEYYSTQDSCSGKLCLRDFDYDYTSIIDSIILGKTSCSNSKFIQNTLDKGKYNRGVHNPVYPSTSYTVKKCLYHIKCVSFDFRGEPLKRYCVTPPSSP